MQPGGREVEAQERGRFLGALDVSIDLPLATPASRSLAYFIDWLVVLLVALLLLVGLTFAAGSLVGLGVEPGVLVAGLAVAWFSLEWLWFVAWEVATGGQTLGKKALGLRVVRTDGRPLGLVGAVVRNLLRPIDTLGGGVLALVVGTLTARHQRLGDLAAGTMVVHVPPTEGPRAVPTRWPDGMGPDDVALVEAWFDRAPVLTEEARAALAARLVAWLERGWPGFIAAASPDPVAALHDAFGVRES